MRTKVQGIKSDTAIGARQGQQSDLRGSGHFQGTGAGSRGCTRCHYVVNEQNTLVSERGAFFRAESARNIFASFGVGESRLGGCVASAPQRVMDWDVCTPRNLARQ